ncbi:MAG: hypothetical protein Q4D81_12940, partial [Eubacteriales bacterium]|nr:hypothetical protein [Eubacteriales bacterium]
ITGQTILTSQNNMEDLGEVLRIYNDICRSRNKLNHARGEITKDQLREKINKLLVIYDRLHPYTI